MRKEAIKNLEYLVSVGAATLNDHIVIPSGKHAKTSFAKYKLYRNTKATLKVSKSIAGHFNDNKIEIVLGMSFGGAILSQLVARELERSDKREVLSMYVGYREGRITLRDNSNLELLKNKTVLIVDDTSDTGKTINELIDFCKDMHSKVFGVAVVCNRHSQIRKRIKTKNFYAFSEYPDDKEAVDEDKCKMCKKGMPISKSFGVRT